MLKNAIVAAAICIGTSGAASAALFGPDQWGGCLGQSTCTSGIFSVSAVNSDGTLAPSVMAEQDFRGFRTLGVESPLGPVEGGPSRNKEIQGYFGESLVVDLLEASRIEVLELGHLYSPNDFDKDPQEVALITADLLGGGTESLRIEAISNTPGGFECSPSTVFATCERIVPSDQPIGRFRITDVFSGPVTRLTFTSPTDRTTVGNGEVGGSDYALRLIQTPSPAPVPLPAAGWTLLGGFAGLFGLRMLRRPRTA